MIILAWFLVLVFRMRFGSYAGFDDCGDAENIAGKVGVYFRRFGNLGSWKM